LAVHVNAAVLHRLNPLLAFRQLAGGGGVRALARCDECEAAGTYPVVASRSATIFSDRPDTGLGSAFAYIPRRAHPDVDAFFGQSRDHGIAFGWRGRLWPFRAKS